MGEVSAWSATDDSNTDLFPENMAFNLVNDGGRAVQGAIARWFKDTDGSITATGSSNAFAITSNRTIASLTNNLVMAFTANHSITGAATLNLNGLGAKSIKRFNSNALATGDIVSGQPILVIYKSSPDVWFMMTAAAALTGQSFADFDENAAPGNPAANTARLFAQDQSGATALAYRDSSGTERVIGGIALQAEMEGASNLLVSVPPGRQHFHPGHPKAGGNFDGSGTPAFASGDYGMGAITDNGTGNYTLALDTAFANTNYWVNGWARSSGVNMDVLGAQPGDTKTSSSLQVRIQSTSGSADDAPEVGITFWGDYA